MGRSFSPRLLNPSCFFPILFVALFLFGASFVGAQSNPWSYREILTAVDGVERISSEELDQHLDQRVRSEGVLVKDFLNSETRRANWVAVTSLLESSQVKSAWFLDFVPYSGELFPTLLVVELPISRESLDSNSKREVFPSDNEQARIRNEALVLVNSLILTFGTKQMLAEERQQRHVPILLPDFPAMLESQAVARDEQRPLRKLQRIWHRIVFRLRNILEFVLGIFFPPS